MIRITKSDGRISEVASLLAPRSDGIQNRLRVSSDFSFAVCDMLGSSHIDMQLLLESPTLNRRLNHLKMLLSNAQDYLQKFEQDKNV